jgi:phage terminase small subunit
METTEATKSPTTETKDALGGLTPKQRLFVEHYVGISNGNGTDAARRAGYAKPTEQAYENLRKPQIKAAVSQRYREAAMGAEEVLARLATHGRATLEGAFEEVLVVDWDASGQPAEYEAETGEPIPSRRVTRVSIEEMRRNGTIHLVKKVTYGQYGPTVELVDAQAALDKIARAERLYTDSLNLTGNVTLIREYPEGV